MSGPVLGPAAYFSGERRRREAQDLRWAEPAMFWDPILGDIDR